MLKAVTEDFNKYKSLPYPVYVTKRNGTVILCNDPFLVFFNIKDKININILSYYPVKEDRQAILFEIDSNKENEWITNRPITFEINEQSEYARFSSLLYRNDLKSEWFLLCIVVSSTGMGKYEAYEDQLSAGLFEISKQNQITHANKKFLEILGVGVSNEQSLDLIKYLSVKMGKDDENIYLKRKEIYTDLLKELSREGSIMNREIALQREDGTNIIVDLNLIAEEEYNGKIHKVKGLIKDITYDSVFEDIQELDIGIFLLDETEDDFVVRHCNAFFKDIFSIDPDQSCIGWNFKRFFSKDVDYSEIYGKIQNIDKSPLDFQVKNFVRTVNSVELSIRVKKVLRGSTNSYVGAIYTDSNEVDVALKNLRNDFSSFLHSFAGTIGNVRDTIRAVISAHGTNAVENGTLRRERAYTYTKSYIAEFQTELQKLYNEMIDKNLNTDSNEAFKLHLENALSQIQDNVVDKASSAAIRSTFLRIQRLLIDYEDIKLISNQTQKKLRNSITQVFRFTRLISLSYLEQESFEMSLEMNAFKDIIASQSIIPENYVFNIHNPVQKAADFLQEYAERMELRIRFHYSKIKSYNVRGDERNLFTVFFNIIHNAIKYSFIKPGGIKSSVDIFIDSNIENYEITIENRGVGIPKDEIENRLIFGFGSRGKSSTDRKRRKGHGIGLWHCEKIISQFGGKIYASSSKIGYGVNIEGTPHITRFIVHLPKSFSE